MFKNLGPTLELLRGLRGLSQTRLAHLAGISESLLSLYETGHQLPKLESLERILSALALSPLDLFSTLEMVDRRAATLDAPAGSVPLLLRSDLLPEKAVQAFNSLITQLLALHWRLLSEAARAWQNREGESHDNDPDEPSESAGRPV